MQRQVDRVVAKSKREASDARRLLKFRMMDSSKTEQKILFVVGCQRSGTSMASQIFKRDPDAFVFNEQSKLSSGDKVDNLRFDALEEVGAKIRKTRAPLVIAKPLVESHRIDEISRAFPGAKFLWLYRNYRDVVKSNLKRWGPQNGHNDLAPIINADPSNWRSVAMSDDTIALVRHLNEAGLSDVDAASLFWYCRNTLYFNQSLGSNPSVLKVSYESLVGDPNLTIDQMYAFAELPTPSVDLSSFISQSSVGRGADVDLSDPLRELCDQMFERLSAD